MPASLLFISMKQPHFMQRFSSVKYSQVVQTVKRVVLSFSSTKAKPFLAHSAVAAVSPFNILVALGSLFFPQQLLFSWRRSCFGLISISLPSLSTRYLFPFESDAYLILAELIMCYGHTLECLSYDIACRIFAIVG